MNNTELKDVIGFAVDKEVDAYEFYKSAAEKIKDENLKQTFKELADEELKHEEFLKDFLSSGLSEINLGKVDDYKVAETVEKPKLSTDMSFSDAIALAMKNEEEAMNMYQKLADLCSDEDKKKLFEELAKMEQMHKARLEDIYTNAAYAEIW